MGNIINGKEVADKRRKALAEKVTKLKGRKPGLVVVQVGDDPASTTYVRSKEKQATEVGFESEVYRLPVEVTQVELLEMVNNLNNSETTDGILVQLPLPAHIDESEVIRALDPLKDVDGLHPENVANLELGNTGHVPCTPKGIMTLLEEYEVDLEGKRVLVIGRSRLVGKPVASLLLQENATVTIAHSKTRNLTELIAEHEVIVVAIGRKEFIKAEQLLPHHIVIDVGIHRHEGKLYGDVEKAAIDKVKLITPVPRGVGPMTIVSLLENTYESYKRSSTQSSATNKD